MGKKKGGKKEAKKEAGPTGDMARCFISLKAVYCVTLPH
jgi:hypothetical protein